MRDSGVGDRRGRQMQTMASHETAEGFSCVMWSVDLKR